MNLILNLNLTIRLFLELGALLALGTWGFKAGSTALTRGLLGLGAPVLAALIWGQFVSPRAAVQVSAPVHLLLEAAVLGSGALALALTGRPGAAWTFAATAVLNRVLLTVWNQ